MKPGQLAGRMQRIKPFYVMDLLGRARALEAQGRDLVHMEVGEPDFPTPAPTIAAGQAALARGNTHYTPSLGLMELRQALADHYAQGFGVSVPASRIVLTPGASGALLLTLGILIGPGDQVLMADPGYPCNRHFVELLEGEPVSLPVDGADGFQLSAQQIEAAWTDRTKAVLIASPSNPTGTLLEAEKLKAVYRTVQRLGGVLIVDEIYHQLVFDSPAHTALSHGDDLFVINSFSKYFGMTGWRLGWVVGPEQAMDALERLAQNIFLAAPTVAQYAALTALQSEALQIAEQRRLEFKRRRDFLLPALQEIGFRIPARPEGAFYIYASCKDLADDSFQLADELLEKAGVAITPGRDFGRNAAQQHVRFAYTTDMGRLEEGVERMSRFFRSGQ